MTENGGFHDRKIKSRTSYQTPSINSEQTKRLFGVCIILSDQHVISLTYILPVFQYSIPREPDLDW